MQELVLETWCDIDFNESLGKVEADEVTWYLEGVPWVVDMCKVHRDTVRISAMDEVVRELGRPLAERRGGGQEKPKDKEKPAVERVECPYPGCDSGRTYKNRSSLDGHFKSQHGVSIATWEAEKTGLEPTVKCDYKGANCRKKFHTVQAMTGHKIQSHGWRKGQE